jgi:hypothetical protein
MSRTSRSGQTALVCLLGALGGAAQAARGAPAGDEREPAVASGIRQLVAGPDAINAYAIRGGDVLTFDASGAVIARCARFAAPPAPVRRGLAGLPDAAETLRAAGLPEDDSTLPAEDLLEDESPPLRRRPRAAVAPILPRALAAEGGGVWIAASDGLYHGGTAGCRRVALAGRDLVAVASDGTTVAAASRELLFEGEVGAGGIAFGPPIALPAAPRALALDRRQGVIVTSARGVLRVGADGQVTRLFEGPAGALASCDGTVLLLTEEALVLWDGVRARVAARPPVKSVACGASPRQRWTAAGAGVWSSPDGVTWTERPEATGLDVDAVISLGGALWIADQEGIAPLRPPAGRPHGLPAGGSRAARSRPGWARSTGATWRLPIVTLAVLVEQTLARRAMTGMLLISLPLDRPAPPAGDASDAAALALRRDAALARDEIALIQAADAAADPAAADELAARLAAVGDEREAPP